MGENTAALKRGWHYDIPNARMEVWVDGTEVARLDSTNKRSTILDNQNLCFGTDRDVYIGVRSATYGTDRWTRAFIDTDAQDTHGLAIGITAGSSDLYGARLSFKWGTGESSSTYAKRTTGLFARLEIDQDLSNSGDVRALHTEVKTAAKDIGGALTAGFFDCEAEGACTVGEGEDATETQPVMCGLNIRLRTTSGAVNLINTTNTQGYAALINLYPYLRQTLDGNISAIQIGSIYEEHGTDVQGTSYGILFVDEDTGVQDYDYAIYINSNTCVYDICVPGLPTSDPSVAGVLYNSSGTVKVSSG